MLFLGAAAEHHLEAPLLLLFILPLDKLQSALDWLWQQQEYLLVTIFRTS